MAHYDYLIVGCGLTGAVIAQQATARNKTVLMLEKRDHVGGNCFTKSIEDIEVHIYGPHIFHTSNKPIWDYVNQFANFKPFINRPKVVYKDTIFSFPINLMTLHQLWGVRTPAEAIAKLDAVKIPSADPANLEEWILSQVGREIYEIFIQGYTTKQWGKRPDELPAEIIKRLPIRLRFEENYYNDSYQGIPDGGYTRIIEKMTCDADIRLKTDYLANRKHWNKQAQHIIYTGMIDEFFDYSLGELDYRSLEFENETVTGDFQGNAVMNYTEESIPYTRIIEHKFFDYRNQPKSVITHEYPRIYKKGGIAYYPVNNSENNRLYHQYKNLTAAEKNITFAGRLGTYSYLDMDDAIENALEISVGLPC